MLEQELRTGNKSVERTMRVLPGASKVGLGDARMKNLDYTMPLVGRQQNQSGAG